MSSVTRRNFMKLVGGGNAALGIGVTVPSSSWAKAETKKAPADEKWSEWEFYYPGQHDAEEPKILKDFMAAWHVLENDPLICNAYVAKKYKKGDEYFLDLIWWDTTLDSYMVQEGIATVKLPKK